MAPDAQASAAAASGVASKTVTIPSRTPGGGHRDTAAIRPNQPRATNQLQRDALSHSAAAVVAASAQPDARHFHAAADARCDDAPAEVVANTDAQTEALKILILAAVQAAHDLGAVTSVELHDYIQAVHSEAVAAASREKPDRNAATAAAATAAAGRASTDASNCRPAAADSSGGDAQTVKTLLQTSTIRELLAVLKVSRQLLEVYDPRDNNKQIAKAYRLHQKATVPSQAELAANIRTLVRPGLPERQDDEDEMDAGGREVQHALAVQQAKFNIFTGAVSAMQEAGGATAGRIRELLSLTQPPTLAAWLSHRRRQMLQRYCLASLQKDGAVTVKDFGGGKFSSLIRYRCAGEPPAKADVKAAQRLLKRVAVSELPPRKVPGPKRARLDDNCAETGVGAIASVAAAAPAVARNASVSRRSWSAGSSVAVPVTRSAAAAAVQPVGEAASVPSGGGSSQPGGSAAAGSAAAAEQQQVQLTARQQRRIEEHDALLASILRPSATTVHQCDQAAHPVYLNSRGRV